MILLIGMACLAVAGAVLCPDTKLGRVLHRVFIATPSRALTPEGLTKGSAGVMILLFLLTLAAAPELMAVIAIADLTIYFEILALAMLIGAGARINTMVAIAALPARWILRRASGARTAFAARAAARGRRVRRKTTRPRQDPDPSWRPAFAWRQPSLAFQPSFT